MNSNFICEVTGGIPTLDVCSTIMVQSLLCSRIHHIILILTKCTHTIPDETGNAMHCLGNSDIQYQA